MSYVLGVMNYIKIKDIKIVGNYCVSFYFGYENICLEINIFVSFCSYCECLRFVIFFLEFIWLSIECLVGVGILSCEK